MNDLLIPKELQLFWKKSAQAWSVKDPSCRFILYNPALLKFLKIPQRTQLTGKSYDELGIFPATIMKNFKKQNEWVMNNHKNITTLENHITCRGEFVSYISEKYPFFDINAQCVGVVCRLREISLISHDFFLQRKLSAGRLSFTAPSTLFNETEWEVIFLLLCGYTPANTAIELKLSRRTIEHFISHCMEKTQTTSRQELIQHCISQQWDQYIPPLFRLTEPITLTTHPV